MSLFSLSWQTKLTLIWWPLLRIHILWARTFMNLCPLSGTRAYVMQFSNPKMVPLLQVRKPSRRNHHWTTEQLFTKPLWWLRRSQMKKLSSTKSLMCFRKGVLSPRCPSKTSSSTKWWNKEISRRWIILTRKGKYLWNELTPWSPGNPNRMQPSVKKGV